MVFLELTPSFDRYGLIPYIGESEGCFMIKV